MKFQYICLLLISEQVLGLRLIGDGDKKPKAAEGDDLPVRVIGKPDYVIQNDANVR